MIGMHANRLSTAPARRRAAGMTLIELMVALAIGSFLILGAVTVFLQGQNTFRSNESLARLQEDVTFALNILEADIRMASYFGLTTRPTKIDNRASQEDSHALGPDDCGANWAVDLDRFLEGSNGAYEWECDADGGGARAGTDTLAIRRAGRDNVVPQAGRMYIQSWRLQPGSIFVGATVPSSDATSEIHELVAHGYYVSQTSALSTPDNAVPSLRRKRLAAGPAIVDEELIPGIEDLQVQFGVDIDPEGDAGRGVVDRYVAPDDAILDPAHEDFLADARILTARVWIRARAERPEVGYVNNTTYSYAGVNFTPKDGFRRIVMSRTIYVRNARPAI